MRYFLYAVFLILMGIVLYFPIFTAGFAGDDVLQLVEYPYFHDNKAAVTIFYNVIAQPGERVGRLTGFFYRPIPFSISTLLYNNTQANPIYFHLLQFAFFVASVYLLFMFFTTFFSERFSIGLAFVFLLHPVNNELAAYIAALADTLCLFFGISAMIIMSKIKKPSLFVVVLVCLLLFLSLLSKEAGILFVILSGIYLFYKKALRHYGLPFVITVGVYLAARIYASERILFYTLPNPLGYLDFFQRLILAPQIVYALLRELIIPTRVALKPGVFEVSFVKSIFPFLMLGFFVSVVGAFWILLKKLKRRNVSNYLFFLCWIVVGTLPYAQLVTLEVLFASRWLYVAEIGLLGMIGTILNTLSLKRDKWFVIGCILIGIIIFLYGLETFILNLKWHDWQRYFV